MQIQKILFTLFAGIFLITSCTDEQEEGPVQFVTKYSKPMTLGPNDSTTVKWDNSMRDLGSVKRGPELEVVFPFKNTGDKPLMFDSVIVTCGCTSFSVPQEPIRPGKKSKIRVKFASDAQPLGLLFKNIYLRANTKGSPYHTLGFQILLTK